MVMDFLKMLGLSRVNTVKGRAQGKAMGLQAKARGKAFQKFNQAVDAPINKAKEAAEKRKGEKPAKSGGGSKKSKMGLFGKGKNRDSGVHVPDEESFSDDAKTAMVDVSEFSDERAHDVVGWVVPTAGAHRGQDFRLVDGKNLLGTAADADIVLTDAYMSSRHATIRHENGRFMLIDLDSTNGTFVNDERITKHELFDNDRVRLGRTDMKFKSL